MDNNDEQIMDDMLDAINSDEELLVDEDDFESILDESENKFKPYSILSTFNLKEINEEDFKECELIDYLKSNNIKLSRDMLHRLLFCAKFTKQNTNVIIAGGFIRKIINKIKFNNYDIDLYFSDDDKKLLNLSIIDESYEFMSRSTKGTHNALLNTKVLSIKDETVNVNLDLCNSIAMNNEDRFYTYSDPFEVIKSFDTLQSTSHIKNGKLYIHEDVYTNSYELNDEFINVQSKSSLIKRYTKLIEEGFIFDQFDFTDIINKYFHKLPYTIASPSNPFGDSKC